MHQTVDQASDLMIQYFCSKDTKSTMKKLTIWHKFNKNAMGQGQYFLFKTVKHGVQFVVIKSGINELSKEAAALTCTTVKLDFETKHFNNNFFNFFHSAHVSWKMLQLNDDLFSAFTMRKFKKILYT